MLFTPAESKAVGYEATTVKFPTLEEVRAGSRLDLVRWYRFLPSGHDPVIINEVIARLKATFPQRGGRK